MVKYYKGGIMSEGDFVLQYFGGHFVQGGFCPGGVLSGGDFVQGGLCPGFNFPMFPWD